MSKSKHEFHRNIAIIIGINDYSNGVRPLETAVPDAQELARIMEEQYQYEVHLMLNQDATLDKLKLLIECFNNKQIPFGKDPEITDKDRILIYFAGHGIAYNAQEKQEGPVGYLIPQDATDNDDTYLKMQDFHDALLKLPCRHLLIILDCCFSGAFYWSSINRDVVPKVKVYKQVYDHYIKYRAWQVITSTSDKQTAVDSSHRGKVSIDANAKVHSPFAKHLFDALNKGADLDNDGIITANDLFNFVRKAVAVETEEYKAQTPGICPLKLHDNGEYLFLLQSEPNLEDAPPLCLEDSPYRGLESYEEEHKDLYFGRQEQIEQLYEKVNNSNHRALTVVLGASGTGKSSLVKAGLIPFVIEQKLKVNSTLQTWHIVKPIRLGESPLMALKNSLSQELNFIDSHPDSEQSQDDELKGFRKILSWFGIRRESNRAKQNQPLEKQVEFLSQNLKNWFDKNSGCTLMLTIDQFEELITLQPRQEQKEQNKKEKQKKKKEEKQREKTQQELVLKWLPQVMSQYGDRLRIVLTLRSDFEAQFKDGELKDYWKEEARFHIKEMTTAELREAITEPASKMSIFFVPNTLIDKLVDEVAGMPGTLPLLSFTLNELYRLFVEDINNGDKDDRAITEKYYNKLGGVARSLTKKAEQEYENLVNQDKAYEQTIRRVMLRMVAVGGSELARRRVLKSELEYPDPENTRVLKVVNTFVDARLLVKGENTEKKPYVEPAHDALVRGWERLLKWKQEEEENLILQRQLTPAADEWKFERLESKDYLWHNNPRLDLLKKELKSEDNWFNQLEAEFVQCSIGHKSFMTQVGLALTSVVILALSAGLIYSLIGQRNTLIEEMQTSRQSAEANLQANRDLEALTDVIRAANTFDDSWIGPLNIGPLNIGPLNIGSLNFLAELFPFVKKSDTKQAQVRGTLYKAIYAAKERNRFQLDRAIIYSVALHPNQNLVAVAGNYGTIRLFNGTQQKQQFPANQSVKAIAFTPDGKWLAIAGDDQITFWKFDDNTKNIETSSPLTLKVKMDISAMAFNINNINKNTENAQIELAIISGDFTQVIGTQYNIDETKKVIFSNQIFSIKDEDNKKFYGIAFGKENKLVTVGENDQITLWEIADKKLREIHTIETDQENVRSVAFANDGKLATGGEDGTVKFWEIKNNNVQRDVQINGKQKVFKPGAKIIYDMSFDTNGKLAILGEDGAVALVDNSGRKISNPIQPQDTYVEDAIAKNMAYTPDGKQVAVVTGRKTIRLWDIASGNQVSWFQIPTKYGDAISLVFTPRDNKLMVGTKEGYITLWNTYGELLDDQLPSWDVNKNTKEKPPQGKPSSQLSPAIKRILFNSDGSKLAVFGQSSDELLIGYFSVVNDEKLEKFEQDRNRLDIRIHDLVFNSTLDNLLIIKKDKSVELWNKDNNSAINIPIKANSVAFSPNNLVFATASENGGIELWNIKDVKDWDKKKKDWDNKNKEKDTKTDKSTPEPKFPEPILRFQTQQKNIQSILFNPVDSDSLLTGGTDGTVRLWNISNKQPALLNNIKRLAFSSNNQLVATLDKDNKLQMWIGDGHRFQSKDISNKDEYEYIAFMPNTDRLVTVDKNYNVKLWDSKGNQFEQLDEKETKPQQVKWLAWSGDGKLLATVGVIKLKDPKNNTSSSRNTVKLWMFENGKFVLKTLAGSDLKKLQNEKLITSIALSLDGKLATTQSDPLGRIKLWNTSGKMTNEFQTQQGAIDSIVFSPDGKRLVTVGGTKDENKSKNTLRLWDINGNQLALIQEDNINRARFSPDGRLVAGVKEVKGVKDDNPFMLWDVSGDKFSPVYGQRPDQKLQVKAFEFNNNGELVILEKDGKVSLWPLDEAQLLTQACKLVGDYLQHNHNVVDSDRKLCKNRNLLPILDISAGNKILLGALNNPDKLLGVEAIASGNFEQAIKFLTSYLNPKKNPNDPEAQIYLNNARIGNQKSYSIAVSVPISSDVNGSLEILRGVAQAQDDFNNWAKTQQGIIPIRVLIADDRNDPKIAQEIAKQLANNPDVLGVVGHFSSSVTREAAQVYNQKELAAISPVSTSVKLSDVLGRYVFRTVPNDKIAAEKLADYTLKSLNKKKAVLFYNSQNEYSQSLSSEFKSAFASQNGQVLEEVDLLNQNFDPQKIRENIDENPALVFLADNSKLNQLFEIVKTNNGKLPILAGDDVYGPQVLEFFHKQKLPNSKGLFVAIPWHIENHRDLDFSTTSKGLWGERDVNWRTVTAYDAAKALIAAAIKPNPNRKEISKILHSDTFTADGAIEKVQFLPSGDRKTNIIELVKIVKSTSKSRSGYDYEFRPVENNSKSKQATQAKPSK